MSEEKKMKTAGLIAGLLIFAFAVTGVTGLVLLAISSFKDAKEKKQQELYAEYSEYLVPVAAIDITPFDDISNASMPELVELSVWSILNSNLEPDAYEYSGGNLVIPASQVKTEFEKFFGTEIQIEHTTVEGYGYEFTYDETNDVYYIPITTINPIYTPVVTDTEEKGNSITVTCGLRNASLWSQDKITGDMIAPEPDKYIKVTLRSNGRDYYIGSVQSTSTPEVAVTVSAVSSDNGESLYTEASATDTATAEASADTTATAETDGG